MSGHSKWATTKRQKFATDSKRSALFTKLAKMITVAVKTGGGGDSEMNFKLRLAIDKAKAASMPKENIERAIKRGLGEGGGENIEEVIYEGILPLQSHPTGLAIIIETLTDNRNRTVSEIRATLTKHGGRMVNSGSVTYLFDQVTEIVISKNSNQLPKDQIEMMIIDSGADDYFEEDESYIVYGKIADLKHLKEFFEQTGITVEAAEIIYKPKNAIEVSEEEQKKIDNLLEALDDLSDCGQIYINL